MDAYRDYETRSAVVAISDGISIPVNVSVTQSGGVWEVRQSRFVVVNEGQTVTVPIYNNITYSCKMPDWMSGEATEEGYRLTVAPNPTGVPRKGIVTLNTERGTAEVTIIQFDVHDLAGQYEALYQAYNSSWDYYYGTNKEVSLRVETLQDMTYIMADGLSDIEGIAIPFIYHPDDGSMNISSCQSVGSTKDEDGQLLHLYTMLYSKDAKYTEDTGLDYTAPIDIDEETGMPVFTFTENMGFQYRSFYGLETAYANGFGIYRFTAPTSALSSESAVGAQDLFVDLILKKK